LSPDDHVVDLDDLGLTGIGAECGHDRDERLAGAASSSDTGECEMMGDDIGGIAVHIAARVSARAEPRELLVSRTVNDLVAGSGLQFTDRGVHTLKGVPDTWQLYAVHV
jgi:class 3 adenylate cyclase